MLEPFAALHDVALSIPIPADLDGLARSLDEIQERWSHLPPAVELFARVGSPDLLALFRFPAAVASPALRAKLETEARRAGGSLVEPALLSEAERERFYSERLGGCEARVDATGRARAALTDLLERIEPARPGSLFPLEHASIEDLEVAVARALTEGHLFVPAPAAGPSAGSRIELEVRARGFPAWRAAATALPGEADRARQGFFTALEPGEPLSTFLARRAAAGRRGQRRRPEGLARKSPRFDACLEARFVSLGREKAEPTLNLGRGGLFVRTLAPPLPGSRVRLEVRFPFGTATTDATVAHVVRSEKTAARGGSPGAGIAFSPDDAAFLSRVEESLSSLPLRRPRVLVAEPDAGFARLLAGELDGRGLDCATASGSGEVLDLLARRLIGSDLLLIDSGMPGLDGLGLIERLRRLGGELGLKVVSVVPPGEAGLPAAAGDAVRRDAPLGEWVRRVERALKLAS